MFKILKIDQLILISILLLYPLFLKIDFFGIRIKLLILIFIFILLVVKFLKIKKIILDTKSYVLILFSIWLIVLLLRNLYIDFQAYNTLYDVKPFFQTNVDNYIDNYYNAGNIKHNIKYYSYMIIFIPLSYILGYTIEINKINLKLIIKLIFIFFSIFSIFIFFDALMHKGGTLRAGGLYDNIGAAQESGTVVLMLFILFNIIYYRYKRLNIFNLYSINVLAILMILATNTRSVILTLIFFIIFHKKPKLMLNITILFSISIILVSLYFSDIIKIISFTNMSSFSIRMDLWNTYLFPLIIESPFWGFGTVPAVTENWLYFIVGVTGFIGSILFFVFIYTRYSKKGTNTFFIFVSVILFQGNIYMGSLGNDLLPLTFFILGFLAKTDYLENL